MPQQTPIIALTCGEPAGIGPEISLKAAWEIRASVRSVLIGNAALLTSLAAGINSDIRLRSYPLAAWRTGAVLHDADNELAVIDCPLQRPVVPGQLDSANGRFVLQTLDCAIEGALQHRFDAIVTAPLQKSTINDAGVPFTGHTEYLAEKTDTPQVVMMLAGDSGPYQLRVALATTHLPMKDVPAAITFQSLLHTIEIIHSDLQHKFGLAQPHIMVTGLNPHAGENGYLGREEIEVITPVLVAAQQKGIHASGPYPADTLFQQKYLKDADCVLAMYHDQGLPVLKHATFGRGVNITLGLPIIRTSVDHGTALDLAALGPGKADHGSMLEAIRQAVAMAAASATKRLPS